MTSLTVTLRYGSTPTSGTVEAIPRTANGVVPGSDVMALGPWRTSINGTGSLAGQGTLTFPANDFTDLTWSFRIRWDAGDKTVTFGPYTYAQISASGVTSLADLIEVEPLEYVATSTLVQRVEALEAGGGGGGGGSAAWVDITGKPLTFPPATHGHPWSEITGKPTTFSPSSHTHGAGDLSGVVKTVNGVGPDGSGNVVVSGGGGGGPLTGTGFPEGNVTATVGTEYIDTAATNGAVKWIKATGTGNTGWRVVYGDTGWRNVTTLLQAQWGGDTVYNAVAIRRINDRVMLHIEGEDYIKDVFCTALGPAWGALTNLGPAAFYDGPRFSLQSTTGGASGQVQVRANGSMALRNTQFGLAAEVSWTAVASTWPSGSLPGTTVA